MISFQLVAIVLFGVGLVLYTIGSFIYFARHPKGFDAMFQASFVMTATVFAIFFGVRELIIKRRR